MTKPTQSQRPRAVILLSGGLDSATTLAIARDAGYDCYCLSLDYGQRHRVELDAAVRVAKALRRPRTTFAMFEKADEPTNRMEVP